MDIERESERERERNACIYIPYYTCKIVSHYLHTPSKIRSSYKNNPTNKTTICIRITIS